MDPGLNHFGMKRDEVLGYFRGYAWDESSMAQSEVKNYQKKSISKLKNNEYKPITSKSNEQRIRLINFSCIVRFTS